MKLSGSTILITGGTSGIGFELARRLMSAGNTVIVTGRGRGWCSMRSTASPAIGSRSGRG